MPSNIIRGTLCDAIYSKGANKGKKCTKRIRIGNYYCDAHTRIYGWVCRCTPEKLDKNYLRIKAFKYNSDRGRWGLGPSCIRCGKNFGESIFRRTELIHPDDRIKYAMEIGISIEEVRYDESESKCIWGV